MLLDCWIARLQQQKYTITIALLPPDNSNTKVFVSQSCVLCVVCDEKKKKLLFPIKSYYSNYYTYNDFRLSDILISLSSINDRRKSSQKEDSSIPHRKKEGKKYRNH